MSKGLKERVKEGIDADMMDKIATEDDAKDIAALKAFLLKVNHPVVDGVTRKVDGKKITEGWKLEEVDDDIKGEGHGLYREDRRRHQHGYRQVRACPDRRPVHAGRRGLAGRRRARVSRFKFKRGC